jgi:hypothetical protein
VEWDEWPEHSRVGSCWGWHIIEELTPGDLICQKNRYDGLYGTWMDHYLGHVWNVKYVVIVGTVSNICVLHTATSAGLRYFHVITPADSISALNDFDQALTLRQVSWLYASTAVRSVDDVQFEDVVSIEVLPQRTGRDLGSTGRAAVDQHHQRNARRQRLTLCLHGYDLALGVLSQQHVAASEKQAGDPHRLV